MNIKAPKGTQDILPDKSGQWLWLEGILRDCAHAFGFGEIRFPVFEHTELFQRGIGDTTDVVQKEMYTFLDKGERSITLRPEGTASVARAFIEHGLHMTPMPFGCYYIAPNFRYERPQKGRLRQHHQFGAEMYGSPLPAADAEAIALADFFLRRIGLEGAALQLNSIGCAVCRPAYRERLLAHLQGYGDSLCGDCRSRMERNPLRVLDCKNDGCKAAVTDAPKSADCLCGDCQHHHETLQGLLTAAGIAYVNNPLIVRGLDYYNRTVFEFTRPGIGAQDTICAGGRYDGLIGSLGGQDTPAVGFGSGLERLLLSLETEGKGNVHARCADVYIAAMGDAANQQAFTLSLILRGLGVETLRDVCGRGLKAQMKYADKCAARHTIVLGDNELNTKRIRIKNMTTGEERECPLDAEAIALMLKGEPTP